MQIGNFPFLFSRRRAHSLKNLMRGAKIPEPVRTGLLTVMQTAVGCGIGLLIAGKLRRPTQKVTAASLFSIGALLAIPGVIGVILRLLNRPGSERGAKKRLESIRQDPGFPDEIEVF
jgi:hypothetical protein